MDLELKQIIEAQGTAFAEFKASVDASIKEGKQDSAETKKKLDALNAELDKCGKQMDEWAKKMSSARSAAELEYAAKQADSVKAMNDSLSSSYAAAGRSSPPSMDVEALNSYAKSFNRWMRSGRDSLDANEFKTMSVGSDPNGGYLVTPDTSGRIISKIFETSNVRAIASVQAIGTDALEGRVDRDEADCGWVGEQQARTATGTPELGKWRIPVHEMYAMPEATVKLLEDASINVEAWLATKVAEKFTRTENSAFVNGNGINKPKGFLSYATAATADSSRAWQVMEHIATGTSGGFGTAPNGTEKLVDLVHALKVAYRNNGRFVLNRRTLGEVRKLKDADGNFLWLPSMTESTPSKLLGYDYSELEDMPDIAANTLSIGFGDFREGYQIVDRLGIRVIRDELTNKPFIRFYTVRRVGGDVVNFDAIKFLKFATS